MSFFNALLPSRNGTTEAPIARRPRYAVTETPEAFDLAISLPGVSREGLAITDENGELTVTGKRIPAPEGRTVLHRETSDSPFELVLSHDNAIDPEKIAAELKDGVLTLRLPKAESAKPRKISVG